MTKPLAPEIKAMRTVVRAIETLGQAERRRLILWLTAVEFETTQDVVLHRLTYGPYGPLPKSAAWTGLPT